MKITPRGADVVDVSSSSLVGARGWAALARPASPWRTHVGATVLAVEAVLWFAFRLAFAGPVSGWPVLAGALELVAWGALVGVVAAVTVRVVRRERAGWVAVVGTTAYGLWQHRAAPWLGLDPVTQYLGQPWAGMVWPPSGAWSTQGPDLWVLGWALVDVVWVVVLGVAVWRWLAAARPGRTVDPGAPFVAGAAVAAAVLVGIAAGLSGLVDGGPASVDAATAFVAGAVVPLLAAALVGFAGLRTALDARPLVALSVGLALDVSAGLLAVDAPGGPQRLGIPPQASPGEGQSVPMIVAYALVTVAACGSLAAVGPLARALRSLAGRPGLSVLLALAANTIDAVATGVGLADGTMVEANPAVRLTGTTVKWVAVTLLLVLLHRVRPRLLWIVTVAYLLVVTYHVVGALFLA